MSMLFKKVDDVDIIATSGHLECASITTKNYPKMAWRSEYECAPRWHLAIPLDIMALRVDLADSLGKLHKISLILLWLDSGQSIKNNFAL